MKEGRSANVSSRGVSVESLVEGCVVGCFAAAVGWGGSEDISGAQDGSDKAVRVFTTFVLRNWFVTSGSSC